MTAKPASVSARPTTGRPTTSTLARRSLFWGFALSAAVLAGAGALNAAAIASHNSEAPVDFSADHMELQDKQKRVLLTGNVDITQEELRLKADRTLMTYTDNDKLTLQRIEATGNVVVTRQDERAAGDVAVYDFNRKIITMVGHVALRRAQGDTLNGGRLVIDLNTGISSIDGHVSAPPSGTAAGPVTTARPGRVSGTFVVPKKDDKKDSKGTATPKP
jgi:lipopolysaccharide export system protein LptA